MKTKIILSLFLLLAFASCKKDNNSVPVANPESMFVTMGTSFSAPGQSVDMDIKNDTFRLHMEVRVYGRFQRFLDFSFQMDSVSGVGTYSLSQGHFAYPDDVRAVLNGVQSYPDPNGPTDYLGLISRTRNKVDTVCQATINPIGVHTLVITKWGAVNEIVEGSISGSLFNDSYFYWINCLNSYEYPYSGSFRLRRKK